MSKLFFLAVIFVALAIWANPILANEDEDVPPTEAEVKKMKIKGLKKFLSDRGLTCPDCFEKGEFIKFALKNREVPILPSKKPRKLSKEPIEAQWKKVVLDLCAEENVDEDKCKPVAKVVEGSFEMHARKVGRQLHKELPELAKISFEEPYLPAGTKTIRQVLRWVKKEGVTSQGKIRSKIDNEIKKFLTALGAENVNPMYEKLEEKDEL